MKTTAPLRTALTALLLSAVLLSLTACFPAADTPPAASAPPPTVTDPPADTADESLRAYYESLIADLRQALLDEKQSDYITERDYEARIAELESKLAALAGGADEPPAGTDIPVSGDATVPPPADTTVTAQPSNPSAAFLYTVREGQTEITAYRGTARAVTIPAEIAGFPVTRIADEAFRATAVTSVTVPDTVTEIGWFAFADCPALTAVTLPASVTSIDYGAFDNTPRLTIHCPQTSYAARYAMSFALRVKFVK